VESLRAARTALWNLPARLLEHGLLRLAGAAGDA